MKTAIWIIEHFLETIIKHIYKEYNIEPNFLPKKAITEQPILCIFYEELLKGTMVDNGII